MTSNPRTKGETMVTTDGYGYGNGYGYGDGSGSGSGSGDGFGFGDGNGYGSCSDGYGYGYGNSYGSGSGSGSSYGYGYGYGSGAGYGDGDGDVVGEICEEKVWLNMVWGVVSIGCQANTISVWERRWQSIAKSSEWDVSEEQANRLIKVIKDRLK